MQIVVVMCLILVAGMASAGASWTLPAPWWASAVGACTYVLVAAVLARVTAVAGLRGLMRGTGQVGRRTVMLAVLTQGFLIAGMMAVMLLGWGEVVNQRLRLGAVPLIGKVVAVIPFLASLVAYWWMLYPLDRAMRMNLNREMAMSGRAIAPPWTRRQYISFNLRHHVLFIAVPAAAVVLLVDVVTLLRDLVPESVLAVGAAVMAGGVVLAAPAAIVRIWRTRPLPPGPLRDRLEAACGRLGLRCRGLRLWDTGGVIANAGVLGLIRQARYVLLTDALLEQMDEPSIEAVFAHEAAHVRYHHIFYMLLLTVGVLQLAVAAGFGISVLAGIDRRWAEPIGLAVAVVAWIGLFGMLSRRFERQADVFAAAAIGFDRGTGTMTGPLAAEGVAAFSDALSLVGRLNGTAETKWNFRHGSIRRRIDFLRQLMERGQGLAGVDRQVSWIKLGICIIFVAGVGVAFVPI